LATPALDPLHGAADAVRHDIARKPTQHETRVRGRDIMKKAPAGMADELLGRLGFMWIETSPTTDASPKRWPPHATPLL
jgi:hypothetical protein